MKVYDRQNVGGKSKAWERHVSSFTLVVDDFLVWA